MTTAPPDEGRNAFLQPYLGKISSFLRVRGDEDKPISFSFGRRVLALDRWERKAIWQALCADLTVIGDWQVMVAEGAAVLLALIQALERVGGTAPTAARMQALHDLASAMVLGDTAMEGLRLRLEAAVAAGQIDLAKGLSGFRIKLLEALAEAHRAADVARETAEEASASAAASRLAPLPVAPPAPPPAAVPAPAPAERAATAPPRDDATAPEDDEASLPVAVEVEEPNGAPAEPQAAPSALAASTPTSQAAPSPAEPEPADGDLELFLARAAAFLRSRGKEDAAVAIRFGSRTLELPAWERRILWQVLCEGVAPGSAWHDQMAAGAALQLAILAALDELDAKELSPGARHRVRAELERAVPLATHLADEIRGAIESMVASGRSDDARRLTGFRNRFIVTLREGRRATETAGGTTTAPPVDAAAAAAGDAKKPTRARLGDAVPDRPSVPPPPPELLPYLERATELIRIRGNEERPVTLTVASKSVSFTAWERRVLWQGLCQEGAVVSPWAELLARGAAVQLGALRASEALAQRQPQAEAQEAARAELALLAGLGNTVLTQLSDEITTQSSEGKVELSKRLKAFWEKLAEFMQTARRGLPGPPE